MWLIFQGWKCDTAASQQHAQGGGWPWVCEGRPEGSREGPDLVYCWVTALEKDVFKRLWGGVAARASRSVFEGGDIVPEIPYSECAVDGFK